LHALATAQDRLREKRLFERLAIPTTRYAAVDSLAGLQRAVEKIGLPGVLKTRRLGYDGKGQCVLRKASDIERAWIALGAAPLLYEEFIPFDLEVSIIGVRGRRGELAFYPLCRNRHHAGILRMTTAPFENAALERLARRYMKAALKHLRYVGVLTIEFFVRGRQLIANEMAPRVHNSGHWTIEGARTSQFENHLRAISGLPLGSTEALGHAGMINLIGRVPPTAGLLATAGLHLHNYGKSARRGRKVGHLTVVAASTRLRDSQIGAIFRRIYPAVAAIL
jgi:5-(carboxyamino)imidazole ribonucleotide synthase